MRLAQSYIYLLSCEPRFFVRPLFIRHATMGSHVLQQIYRVPTFRNLLLPRANTNEKYYVNNDSVSIKTEILANDF